MILGVSDHKREERKVSIRGEEIQRAVSKIDGYVYAAAEPYQTNNESIEIEEAVGVEGVGKRRKELRNAQARNVEKADPPRLMRREKEG